MVRRTLSGHGDGSQRSGRPLHPTRNGGRMDKIGGCHSPTAKADEIIQASSSVESEARRSHTLRSRLALTMRRRVLKTHRHQDRDKQARLSYGNGRTAGVTMAQIRHGYTRMFNWRSRHLGTVRAAIFKHLSAGFSFGTRGSQVQILPLRPAFPDFQITSGTDCGTDTLSPGAGGPTTAVHPAASRRPGRSRNVSILHRDGRQWPATLPPLFEDEPQRRLSTKRSFSTVTGQTSVVLGLLIQTFYPGDATGP